MNVQDTVDVTGLSTAEIKGIYKNLSVRGDSVDPLANWYLLVRHVNSEKRRKLKGKALLAQDYYERAYVLKFLLEDLGEREIPEPDDVMDPFARGRKVRRYGHNVDYADRNVLKKILGEFGIETTHKVILFIEDESNMEAVRIIAHAIGIDLERKGIHAESLDSSASFNNPAFRKRLRYIQEDGAVAYIMVDNENDSSGHMFKLVKTGLIGENCFRIWDGEFESDNWSDQEILDQVRAMAKENSVTIDITIQALDEYRQSKVKDGKPKPMTTKAIEALLSSTNAKFSIKGRKVDLNRRLACVTSNRIKRMLQKETYSVQSPIEKELMKISDIARFGLPRTSSGERR